jgi:hypothetical protein
MLPNTVGRHTLNPQNALSEKALSDDSHTHPPHTHPVVSQSSLKEARTGRNHYSQNRARLSQRARLGARRRKMAPARNILENVEM